MRRGPYRGLSVIQITTCKGQEPMQLSMSTGKRCFSGDSQEVLSGPGKTGSYRRALREAGPRGSMGELAGLVQIGG